MIGFHGVINENAAKYTKLTELDVELLLEAMWMGTKGLLSRSKKGHMPRLLVKIDYSQPLYFIGDLVERIKITCDQGIKEDALSDVSNYTLDVTDLNAVLQKNIDKIARITVLQDERILLSAPIFQPNK